MIRWLANWLLGSWYEHCRAIDVELLWPAILKHARSMDEAKAAFAVHAFSDPAWAHLGDEDVRRRIEELR